MKSDLPIGVFDSGMGGLTVLNALRSRLPNESFLYLGDTARLPYGTKSQQTVLQYAQQAAHYLVRQGVKMLVIACNTASAMALPALQRQLVGMSVIGVIEPGARAACEVSKTRHIVVAATEGTIANRAYQYAIHRLLPNATVIGKACSMFVALAEEGWLDDEITQAVVRRYLLPLFSHQDQQADCLLLGCTHFPALLPSIQKILGDKITIVDSARTTAEIVAKELTLKNLVSTRGSAGEITYFATDAKQRFATVANYFLQETIMPEAIQLVDLV